MSRDHHQIAKPAEVRDDVFGNALAQVIIAGITRRFVSASTAIAGLRTGSPSGASRGACAGWRRLPRRMAPPNRCRWIRKCFSGAADPMNATTTPGRVLRHFAGRGGHEDAARIGDGLKTRRDIDAMAIGDQLVKRHFADIEPDAELDRLAIAPNRLIAKFRLDLNSELQRLSALSNSARIPSPDRLAIRPP